MAASPPGRSRRAGSWPKAMPARPASGFATASSAKGYGRKRFACPGPDRIVASHGPRQSPRPPSRHSLRIGRSGARTLGCQAHRPVPRRGRCATGGRDRVRLRCPAVVHPSFGHRPGRGRDRCRGVLCHIGTRGGDDRVPARPHPHVPSSPGCSEASDRHGPRRRLPRKAPIEGSSPVDEGLPVQQLSCKSMAQSRWIKGG